MRWKLTIHSAELHCTANMSTMLGAGGIEMQGQMPVFQEPTVISEDLLTESKYLVHPLRIY